MSHPIAHIVIIMMLYHGVSQNPFGLRQPGYGGEPHSGEPVGPQCLLRHDLGIPLSWYFMKNV